MLVSAYDNLKKSVYLTPYLKKKVSLISLSSSFKGSLYVDVTPSEYFLPYLINF